MHRGHTLPELAVVLAVAGVLLAVSLPRLGGWLDRVAVEGAARRVTLAISVARHRAIAWSAPTRIWIRPVALTVDTLGWPGWGPWSELPGPVGDGVGLTVSNPLITFTPNGIASGFSNTRVVLSRGSQSATITVSRVGRVKRW